MGSMSYTVPKDDVHDVLALIGHRFAGLRFEIVSVGALDGACNIVVTWPNDQVIPDATGVSPLHDKLRESEELRVGLQAWLDQTIALKDDAAAETSRALSRAATAEAEVERLQLELQRAVLDTDDGTQL